MNRIEKKKVYLNKWSRIESFRNVENRVKSYIRVISGETVFQE